MNDFGKQDIREVYIKFCVELQIRKDEFFKTIYPTLSEEAKRLLTGELK